MKMDIEKRINALKRELDLKNTDIAGFAGVSKQAVGGWINSGNIPSEEAGRNLQEKLGVSSEWLRHGVGPMFIGPPSGESLKTELERYLDTLPASERSKAAAELVKLVTRFL